MLLLIISYNCTTGFAKPASLGRSSSSLWSPSIEALDLLFPRGLTF